MNEPIDGTDPAFLPPRGGARSQARPQPFRGCRRMFAACMAGAWVFSSTAAFGQDTTSGVPGEGGAEAVVAAAAAVDGVPCVRHVGRMGNYFEPEISNFLIAKGHTVVNVNQAFITGGGLSTVDVLYIDRNGAALAVANAAAIGAWVMGGGTLITEFWATRNVGQTAAFGLCELGESLDDFYVPSGNVCGGNVVTITDPASPLAAGLPASWLCSGDPIGVFVLYASIDPGFNVVAKVGDLPVVATCCKGQGRWIAFFTDFGDWTPLEDPRVCPNPLCRRSVEDEQLLLNAVCAEAPLCCSDLVLVKVYEGYVPEGGGAPYSGLVGMFEASGITFGTDTGFAWHPFGLGEFGAEITGIITVCEAGEYSFCLTSDDGSLLFIDDVLVVDNGNPHPPGLVCGTTTLTAGLHKIKVQFFECCGGPSGVDLVLPSGVAYGCQPCCKPSICGSKYYDVNANGIEDPGEEPVVGWLMGLLDETGMLVGFQMTGEDGSYCFVELGSGSYTVVEFGPVEGNWMPTTPTWCTVEITREELLAEECEHVCEPFGNLCLGAGGAKSLGFWSNKNGQAMIGGDDTLMLSQLCLVKKDGSPFDPGDKAAVKTWLLDANAVNMAYMLSAQLATMALSVHNGLVDPARLVYAPGCGNTGVGDNFITVRDLVRAANAALCLDGKTPDGDPNRARQECLKNALDRANNNWTFVQLSPCPATFPL